MKERGPEDAAPPPAPPVDQGAVQTYFLDPANGRWQPTILGLRARQIAAGLGNAYRTAAMTGLAMAEQTTRNPRLVVEYEDGHRGEGGEHRSRAALRFIGAAVVLVVLIGGGAVAANTFLGPLAANADATPAGASAGATTIAHPRATPELAAATADAAASPTTTAPAQTNNAPTATPRRTTATAAPITTVTYSTRLSNGTTITYTGPSGVAQANVLYLTFRATQANGQPAFDNLNVYLGTASTMQAVTVQADASGTYNAAFKVTLPKGDQLLSIRFGLNGGVQTMGTITVH